MLNRLGLGLLFTTGAAFFAGCQSVPVQDLPANADPTAEIRQTESDLNTAANDQLDVASPKHFSDAKNALEDAKKERDNGKDSEKILHNVALARGYLKQAQDTAAVEKPIMADTLAARQAAVAAGAPKVDAKRFSALDDRLETMGRDVEKDDVSNAKDEHGHLAAEYRNAQIEAVKTLSLRTARGYVEQAENEGAKKEAPRTLAIAEQSIAATEQFIQNSPEDKAGIQAKVDVANGDAKHALDTVRAVKVASKTRPEEEVLSQEAAAQKLADQQKALNDKEAALAAQTNQVNTLNSENSQLQSKEQAEQDFQKKFAAASAAFSPSEAEVLRDGNRLVIRLKALTFPSGKQTIPTEDYAVLAKAQQVMKTFGAQAVDVQGHTDSVGGAKLNQRLSEQRADAVKSYLVANGAIDAGKITAEGYGESRPLASNKSASGRAQNRRIDLLLTPSDATAH